MDTGTVYTRPLLPNASSVSTVRHSKVPYRPSPALKAKLDASWPCPWRARTQPFCETTTVTGSSITLISATVRFSAWISVRRASANCLASCSISLTIRRRSAAGLPRMSSSCLLLFAQLLELLLDLDRLQPRQLAQPDFQDVLGLAVAQLEARDQRGLGLVAAADDGDHFVDVQQHQLPALEDVDAVEHLAQPVLRAPLDRGLAELDPFQQHLAQRLLHRLAVQPDRREVDRATSFPGWCAPAACR